MTNERKIMKGHEFTFNQQQEGLADRFLNMANSLENPRDRNHYAENILANMKDDIEKVYKGNALEFLAREAEKPFYKQMDKIRKETDEIVEALNKERDRLHAEKETQLKAQQEAEKAAEIERIANYDLETAYKEKAHLEKIMQSNRNDYSPYSFSHAHNSEFLDKLDLVEQRIRDLKNKLPNTTPQENKPSKVEALKDFMDDARFQVDYAIKAKGTDTALKLIQQMIKDTNNTYEAKFLYRLKNEVSELKGTETNPNIKAQEKALNNEIESNFTYTTQETKGIRDLRNDLKEALNPYLNKEIVNKEQGLSGVITTEEVKKIMSKKAIDKSVANGFSRDEHIEVAKHIERLFAESKLSRSHKDYKDNPNILQVHRFIKDININGKEANAQITLFEKIEGKNKIYTIELESLEKPTSLSTQAKSAEVAVKAQSAAATPTEAAPIAKTDTDIIPQNANTINILKDMQDKDINVKLDNKELLELYEKSSREAYDVLAQKLYLDSVKQYRSDGYALFENSSLGANAKGSFEAILRKNIRQRQVENFQKPQNVKYEIQTEQGFKYYLDENNDVVINHKNELVDFKGGVVRTKPDKDGDILELNGILKLISPRNADNMFLAKRGLTNNEFYDFHANLRLANYYQNGLFVSDEKLYEVFKNMPRNADKQGLDDVMGILRGLTKSKNVNMAYAQEFIDKHYGLEADYRTLARDIFKRVDKEYKKNGNPFGILFNDQKAIKDLSDMYGDEMARDFFKGKNAVDFLLYTQAGHIENAFYKEGLGGIDLVWGEVQGKGKEAKGWGLAKIIEKHGDEFSSFSGNTEEQKLINGINEIIQNGKLLTENGVNTLYLQKDNKVFLVGLSKGWDKKGENQWIITSYEANNLSPDILEKIGANKTFPADESLNALQTFNATDSTIIPQQTLESTMQKFNYDEKRQKTY